jgi:hypothetical protein
MPLQTDGSASVAFGSLFRPQLNGATVGGPEGIVVEYDNWQEALAAHTRCWSQDVGVRWAQFLREISVGALVSGTVIAQAPFGAWIDVGPGFAALLELPFIRGLTPELYRTDNWLPVGSAITARVQHLGSDDRRISLAQVMPQWTTISEHERLRLLALVRSPASCEEAIATLGPPDEDDDAGLLTYDPATMERQSFRVLHYNSLSDFAKVRLIAQPVGPLLIELDRKRLEPLDLQ